MSELNARQPTFQEIGERIKSPLWNELCGYIEAAYGVQPRRCQTNRSLLLS